MHRTCLHVWIISKISFSFIKITQLNVLNFNPFIWYIRRCQECETRNPFLDRILRSRSQTTIPLTKELEHSWHTPWVSPGQEEIKEKAEFFELSQVKCFISVILFNLKAMQETVTIIPITQLRKRSHQRNYLSRSMHLEIQDLHIDLPELKALWQLSHPSTTSKRNGPRYSPQPREVCCVLAANSKVRRR